MPNFAANLSRLFNEIDFISGFCAAKKSGFPGVAYLFPHAYPPKALAAQLREHVPRQVLFNLPAGNWSSGERGDELGYADWVCCEYKPLTTTSARLTWLGPYQQ